MIVLEPCSTLEPPTDFSRLTGYRIKSDSSKIRYYHFGGTRGRSPSGYRIEDRIEADLEFHRTLCRLSENDTLLHAWEQLEGSVRMSIMFGGYERGVRNMDVARHFKLVDTIEAGDSAAVSAEISEHMRIAAETLMGS